MIIRSSSLSCSCFTVHGTNGSSSSANERLDFGLMITSAGRSSGSDFITLVTGIAGVDVVAGLTGAAGVAGVEGEETSSI